MFRAGLPAHHQQVLVSVHSNWCVSCWK